MRVPKNVSVIDMASFLYFILLIVFVVSMYVFPVSGATIYGVMVLFSVGWAALCISMGMMVGLIVTTLPMVMVILYGIIKFCAVFYFSK